MSSSGDEWISAAPSRLVDNGAVQREPLVVKHGAGDENGAGEDATTSKYFNSKKRNSSVLSSDDSDIEVVVDSKFKPPDGLKQFFAKTTLLSKPKKRIRISSDDDDDEIGSSSPKKNKVAGGRRRNVVSVDSDDDPVEEPPIEDLLNISSDEPVEVIDETDLGSETSPLKKKPRERTLHQPAPRRMKLLKTKNRIRFGSSSEDEDAVVEVKHVKPADKKNAMKKKNTIEIGSSDDEVVGVDNEASDNDEYEDDLLQYIDSEPSSSNEEPDSPVKKPKSKKALVKKEKVESIREEVLKFVQEATVGELMDIPGVAKKVADNIVVMRPFENWQDMRIRLDNIKGTRKNVREEIINTIQSRRAVNKIMADCISLSERIADIAKDVRPTNQPALLNKEFKLSDYQLIGLNWLLIMYRNKTNAILGKRLFEKYHFF